MMMRRNKILLAVVAAAVILTTILGTVALANSPTAPAEAGSRTVSVSGTAQITLKPDIAYVSFGTLTQDANAATARDANNKLMAKVFDALKAQGVDVDKDVKTTNYSINPRYDMNGSKITGYEISNNIQVKVRNLDKLGDIMTAASAAGANLAGGLTFDVENREDAYNQVLEKAIDNARMRAETLAKSAGSTLGAVVAASESGSYNPYPIYYGGGPLRDGGVPVSAGTLQVSASVSVTFELK